MPRKQRFKPSRKPKPVETTQDSLTERTDVTRESSPRPPMSAVVIDSSPIEDASNET